MARMEFELVYSDVAVQHISSYATGFPSHIQDSNNNEGEVLTIRQIDTTGLTVNHTAELKI